MKLTIRGVLTTTAFTHQTDPNEKGMQIKTAVISDGKLITGVPVIQANSVRGLLRRAAADELAAQVIKNLEKVSRNLYLSIYRGAFARTGLNAGGATYQQMSAAADHIFAGLFGGGAYMYRSTVRFERDLIPAITATRPLLPAEIQAHAIDVPHDKLLTTQTLAPRDDFAVLPKSAIDTVDDIEAAYTEHMQTKVDQSAAIKAGESEKRDDLNTMANTQGIIPGVPLAFGISTSDISPAQCGMLLAGLLRWANRNTLGGGSARGRGSFIPTLSLSIDGKRVVEQLFVGEAPYLTFAESPEITQLLAALDALIADHCKVSYLSSVFPTEIKAKPEKATKGKGKPAAGDASVPAGA